MKFFTKNENTAVTTQSESTPVSVFPLPTLESGMTDHIISHRSGDEFQYVALAFKSKESNQSLMSRLRNSHVKVRKEEIPVKDLPIIKLSGELIQIPLSASLSKMKNMKDYLLLKEVIIHYVPLESFHDNFNVFTTSLHDLRRDAESTMVRDTSVNGNVTYTARFGLDYCIPSDKSDMLELRFNYKNPNLITGNQWGAARVSITLLQMDFPVQTDVTKTVGMISLPSTAFEKPDRDPRSFQAAINGEDLDALRQFHEKGMIVDSSKPAEVTARAVTYAGTSFKGKGKAGGSDEGLEDDSSSVANSGVVHWANEVKSPGLETVEENSVIEDLPEGPAHKRVMFTDI